MGEEDERKKEKGSNMKLGCCLFSTFLSLSLPFLPSSSLSPLSLHSSNHSLSLISRPSLTLFLLSHTQFLSLSPPPLLPPLPPN